MPRLYALILALLVAFALPAGAQEAQAPDYDAWEKLAGQAEQILETDQANEARLQAIRAEVVKWRDQFKSQEGANSPRISTLKDQIEALGPPPAEGETESEEVAGRRQELNDQLSQLQAPGLKAVEALRRANGIVNQIDQKVRTQQAVALVRKTSTPLNPANWAPALSESGAVARNIFNEVNARWLAKGGLGSLRDSGPFVIGFLLLALLLLTRGRHWVDSLPSRLSARASERSRAALIFLVSLGQIVIPLLGVILAVGALFSTGLFGDWGRPLLFSIPTGALCLFGGVWLGRRLFPDASTGVPSPLPISEVARGQARFRSSMLALALALHQIFARSVLPLAGFNSEGDSDIGTVPERLSEASAGVWHFLLILLGAFYLFNLCNILRRLKRQESHSSQYRTRIFAVLGMCGRVIAVLAPIAAALGYITATNAVLWSTVLTLALIGFLLLVQDLIADLYGLAVDGNAGSARESLIPVLISFALVVLSLPLFALIWGARGSDLSEAWERTQEGFSFGGIHLSPTGIVTFMLVFAIGYGLTRAVQNVFRNSVLPKTRMDSGGQNAVVSIIGYIGIGIATMLAITSAGIDLSSLAFVAGALSVGIGFGMQQVVSNFVSGIILLVERPVAVGDWIEVGGKQGVVRKMAVRATQIQTFDRNEIIVPNSDLITQQVTNWTRGNLTGRIIVPVGVAYGTDTRKVERILREIAEDQPTVMINPPPAVLFRGFGADSMDFEIRALLSDINGGVGVTSEINHEIARRFAEEGIEIPYAQRDIWLRNPEALAGAERKSAEAGGGAQIALEQADKSRPLPRDEAPDGDADGDADGGDGGDGDGR